MGLFSKKKEEDKKESPIKSEENKVSDSSKSEPKKKKEEKKVLSQDVDGSLAYEFIVKPWITEKTHDLMASDKYVFKVRKEVNKSQTKEAIEKLYGVEVDKINIINIPQKKRRFGRIVGKKSAIKKAIVTLKEGNKIEFFE